MDTVSIKDIFVYVLLPICAFIAHQVWSMNGCMKEFKIWAKGHETLDNSRHEEIVKSLDRLEKVKT